MELDGTLLGNRLKVGGNVTKTKSRHLEGRERVRKNGCFAQGKGRRERIGTKRKRREGRRGEREEGRGKTEAGRGKTEEGRGKRDIREEKSDNDEGEGEEKKGRTKRKNRISLKLFAL